MQTILTNADIAELEGAYPDVHPREIAQHVQTANGLTLEGCNWQGGEPPMILRAAAACVVRWKLARTQIEIYIARDNFLSCIDAYNLMGAKHG